MGFAQTGIGGTIAVVLALAGSIVSLAEETPLAPKLTPWEDCFSQIAEERIAGCTFVLEQEERDSADRVTAFINRGVAYGQRGDMGLAIDEFDRALELAPANGM